MEYDYRIAGLTVRMDTFGRTLTQAEPYRCQRGEADMVIHSDWQSLKAEQPHLSDEDCEYLSTGASFYRQLLRFDGMLIHASAVVMDGKAYLFSAPCGTGKSTHTQLWLKRFGNRAMILNDDKPALRLENGEWYAYGTPWSGKYDVSANVRVPVAGICMLHRAETNSIVPFSGPKAIFSVLEQTVRPNGAVMRGRMMELLDALLSLVPVWSMGCNMDLQAAEVSYTAMSGAGKEKKNED